MQRGQGPRGVPTGEPRDRPFFDERDRFVVLDPSLEGDPERRERPLPEDPREEELREEEPRDDDDELRDDDARRDDEGDEEAKRFWRRPDRSAMA